MSRYNEFLHCFPVLYSSFSTGAGGGEEEDAGREKKREGAKPRLCAENRCSSAVLHFFAAFKIPPLLRPVRISVLFPLLSSLFLVGGRREGRGCGGNKIKSLSPSPLDQEAPLSLLPPRKSDCAARKRRKGRDSDSFNFPNNSFSCHGFPRKRRKRLYPPPLLMPLPPKR